MPIVVENIANCMNKLLEQCNQLDTMKLYMHTDPSVRVAVLCAMDCAAYVHIS